MPSQSSEQARKFAEEVQAHEPDLRTFLRGRFPNLRDVDDLIQETYARFFRARSSSKIREPRAYLFATARHAAFDHYRRNRNVAARSLGETELESVVEDSPNAAENASRGQELEMLNQAIEALPDRCKEVLKLRRFQGLSYREIGEKLGISENTVNAQLAIAMVRCHQHFHSRGILKREQYVFHP